MMRRRSVYNFDQGKHGYLMNHISWLNFVSFNWITQLLRCLKNDDFVLPCIEETSSIEHYSTNLNRNVRNIQLRKYNKYNKYKNYCCSKYNDGNKSCSCSTKNHTNKFHKRKKEDHFLKSSGITYAVLKTFKYYLSLISFFHIIHTIFLIFVAVCIEKYVLLIKGGSNVVTLPFGFKNSKVLFGFIVISVIFISQFFDAVLCYYDFRLRVNMEVTVMYFLYKITLGNFNNQLINRNDIYDDHSEEGKGQHKNQCQYDENDQNEQSDLRDIRHMHDKHVKHNDEESKDSTNSTTYIKNNNNQMSHINDLSITNNMSDVHILSSIKNQDQNNSNNVSSMDSNTNYMSKTTCLTCTGSEFNKEEKDEKKELLEEAKKKDKEVFDISIYNIMFIDTPFLIYFITALIELVNMIIKFIMSFYMFYYKMGSAAVLNGALLIIIMYGLMFAFEFSSSLFKLKYLKYRDTRISNMHHILKEFKLMKIFNWESIAFDYVNMFRIKEMKICKIRTYLSSLSNYVNNISVNIVEVAIFFFLHKK